MVIITCVQRIHTVLYRPDAPRVRVLLVLRVPVRIQAPPHALRHGVKFVQWALSARAVPVLRDALPGLTVMSHN